MKVIFSRKGFDSGYGGIPSPILPDGTMLSLPIPSKGDKVLYHDLHHAGKSYYQIIRDLNSRTSVVDEECHLDPDIRPEVINRMNGWKPAFGQCGPAQTHLLNQGVGVGDIFLFFGWFRETEFNNDKLRYKGPTSGFHAIYGYMQVGDIVTNMNEVPDWLKSHPHANELRMSKSNAIYIGADSLSIDSSLPGVGCLRYTEKQKLTKPGFSRSVWNLPDFFREIPITYHANAWKEDGFHSVAKGQEFVFTATDEVITWLKDILA